MAFNDSLTKFSAVDDDVVLSPVQYCTVLYLTKSIVIRVHLREKGRSLPPQEKGKAAASFPPRPEVRLLYMTATSCCSTGAAFPSRRRGSKLRGSTDLDGGPIVIVVVVIVGASHSVAPLAGTFVYLLYAFRTPATAMERRSCVCVEQVR